MRFVKTMLGFGLLAASVAVLRGRRRALGVARPNEVSFDDTVGTSGPSHDTLEALDDLAHLDDNVPTRANLVGLPR